MSSNAGRTTLSLNRFVNAWGFPLLSGTTAVTMLVTYVVTFEAMKPFMDPARIDAARYAYHHIGFIPMIGVGIALAIVMRMRSVFNREVIRKTRRLASAAVTCYDKPRRNPLTAWSRITELEQLRTVLNRLFGDQFARIEELLDLTHTLKHNVNNLLQVIVIAAEEIAVKCADGTNGTCDAARRIVLCVERMKTILSVNISITENYNHLREPPRECVDVSEVLLTCADTIEPAAEGKDIRVTVNLPKEPISFSGHTQKLLNLLQNLADNAVKYTPPGGNVTISATTAEVPATPSRRGALAAIIMYDYFGANFPLADAVLYVSKVFGCYSTCAILYKIGTLMILRRPKAAFLRVLTTVATLAANIALGLLYLGIQASRIG